jgi:hypothetical protein
MANPIICPVVVPLPIIALGSAVLMQFPIPERINYVELLSWSVGAQALTSGTYTVELRRLVSGALLDTISVTSGGVGGIVTHDDLRFVFNLPNAGLRFDVTGIGVGPVAPHATVWMAVLPTG